MNNNHIKWLTESELQSLLPKPENEHIERCESAKNTDKIAKAICAFSNNLSDAKKPSVIFIGLKDNGEYSNLPITNELQRNIASIRDDGRLQPFPIINIKTLFNKVIIVQVQASHNPPVRYKNQCWVRIGPSVRLASEEEERRLIEKRQASYLPYDMSGLPDASTKADIDITYFKNHYLPSAVSKDIIVANNRNIETQMRSLRLLDYKYRPTVTAILLMGTQPRNWFPGAYIQFVRFEGHQLTDPVRHQKEISGTLPEQVTNIENLFRINIPISLKLSDNKHIEQPDYPLSALQQLIRNAIIHRDYKSNNPVRVYWFNDRIEIQSPGGPFGELNIDNFGTEGLTAYRNPTIAETFKNLNFIERFGYGIPYSKKALKENGNPDLQLQASTSTVLAIIKKVC